MSALVTIGVVLVLCAQAWSADIIPADRLITWTAGIAGGIPARPSAGRTTINVKSGPYNAVGDGVNDDTAEIQAAIDASTAGDVIYFPSGTYLISTRLLVAKGVTLRGEGVSSRILIAGGIVGLRMGREFSSFGAASTLTGSFLKGDTQIILSSNPGTFVAGDILVVDQTNPTEVDIGDGSSYLCEDRSGGGLATGTRCVAQFVELASISGTTMTLTEPLHWDYPSSRSPRVYEIPTIKNVGLESLLLERKDEDLGTGTAHIIQLFECAYCWISKVQTKFGRGAHVQMWWTYGSVIRDSFFYMGHTDFEDTTAQCATLGVDGGESLGAAYTNCGYDSGRNYGVMFAFAPSSKNLVENNIFDSQRHSIICEGPCQGNVFAYNYILNNVVNDDLGWVAGAMANHGAHPSFNLWEGNINEDRLGFDYTHGSGSHNTVYRNRLYPGDSWKTGGRWAVDLQQRQWYVNVVGNVLGNDALTTVYDVSGAGSQRGIYRLGHASDGGGTITDTTVATTLLRWGNYDYVNDAFRWETSERPDGATASHTLAASLYLASKPSWFGTLAWPPFGPDPTTPTTLLNATIPAKECYNTQGLADGVGFNPDACYYSTPPTKSTVKGRGRRGGKTRQ